MPRYLDGYVIPVPKRRLADYRRMAKLGAKLWREHGALEYRKCVGEDLSTAMGLPFTRPLKLKPGETVVFAWVVFKSRAHRDRVNANVMNDPRAEKVSDREMPFDMARMLYGGSTVWVESIP